MPDAIRRRVWLDTDRTYRLAARRLIEIKSEPAGKGQADGRFGGFFERAGRDVRGAPAAAASAFWIRIGSTASRKWSGDLASHSGVLYSRANLSLQKITTFFVSTEGTRLQFGRTFTNSSFSARGKADDGMDLATFEDFQGNDLTRMASPAVIEAAANRTGDDLSELLVRQR